MKLIKGLVLAMFLGGCSPKLDTILACSETVESYAVLRDDPSTATDYAALFTEDGSFELGGQVVTGREALAERHDLANDNAVWRHNITYTDIIEQNGELSGRSRFVIQTGPRGASPGPVTREIIGFYEDKFTLEGGECLIASRKVHIEFDTHRDVQKD